MRARDRDAVRALRSLLAAIDNAGAIEVEHEPTAGGSSPIAGATAGAGSSEARRHEVDAAGLEQLVAEHLAELRQAGERYERMGEPERAAAAGRELAALERLIRA